MAREPVQSWQERIWRILTGRESTDGTAMRVVLVDGGEAGSGGPGLRAQQQLAELRAIRAELRLLNYHIALLLDSDTTVEGFRSHDYH